MDIEEATRAFLTYLIAKELAMPHASENVQREVKAIMDVARNPKGPVYNGTDELRKYAPEGYEEPVSAPFPTGSISRLTLEEIQHRGRMR
jgi:hypothetical protein